MSQAQAVVTRHSAAVRASDGGAMPTGWTRRGLLGLLLGSGATAATLLSRRSGSVPRPIAGNVSFGDVAVLTAVLGRRPHLHDLPAAGAGHEHGWRGLLEVEVALHNASDRSVPFSPGQFRLRLAAAGPTVTPYAADPPPGVLRPGSTDTVRIAYLIPLAARRLALDYDDPGTATRVRLPLAPAEGAP